MPNRLNNLDIGAISGAGGVIVLGIVCLGAYYLFKGKGDKETERPRLQLFNGLPEKEDSYKSSSLKGDSSSSSSSSGSGGFENALGDDEKQGGKRRGKTNRKKSKGSKKSRRGSKR